MRAILQFIGPSGVGKTTLSELLLRELSGHELLILDTSSDEALRQRLHLKESSMTLARLAQSFLQKPNQSNEAIDWAFRDMLMPLNNEEDDLLVVGDLPPTIPSGVEKMLTYGLQRLLAEYEYIIVDGYHPLLAKWFPPELLQTLVIVTPEQSDGCFIPEAGYRTPALMTNRYDAARISAAFQSFIDEALESGKVRLIGKLPECSTPQALSQDLPKAFRNALLRLDLPHNASFPR